MRKLLESTSLHGKVLLRDNDKPHGKVLICGKK